ncbi:hypothetical protein [Lysobacter sp. Root916]|uniref:hypothetical protein n=1 Tax=Lysobacter sp. Root916 TaxID=1736606 RepID=UPI000B22B56E|nr:hypothetical protein [Lysobacter sp. Root916]
MRGVATACLHALLLCGALASARAAEPRAGALYVLPGRRAVRRRPAPDRRARQQLAYGGNGIAHPQGDARSGWRVQRDIVLGLNVPGYARCGR